MRYHQGTIIWEKCYEYDPLSCVVIVDVAFMP